MAAEHPEQVERLGARLPEDDDAPGARELTDEEREQLRALGYVR